MERFGYYAELIRLRPSRGTALFVGQPAMLKGVAKLLIRQLAVTPCLRARGGFTHTHTHEPFSSGNARDYKTTNTKKRHAGFAKPLLLVFFQFCS